MALAWLCGAALLAEEKTAPAKPTAHTIRQVQGWTVRVDERLLAPPEAELGARALALLEAKLVDIKSVMAPAQVVKCQQAAIVLDLSHGGLTSMQYHPSAGWLKSNGYAEDLARCVHIPVAASFVDAQHNRVQPWCVLHELAHAFHDQVLTFEDKRVEQVWKKYMDSGHGVRVLFVRGNTTRHYAMTNHKEFFAEMSEAYFGTNDFFPFVHGELKEAEPETYALLQEIWGPVAGS